MELVRFNLRVYGLMINEKNEILLVDEEEFGTRFTKFPGGGLELGESTRDCLKREWMEEMNLQIEVVEHFYTTDIFQHSAFRPEEQLISIYYFVKPLEDLKTRTSVTPFDFVEANSNGEKLSFRWISLDKFSPNEVSFPIDKLVAEKIIGYFKMN